MATEEDVKLAERLAELEEKIRAGKAEEEELAEAIKDLTEAQIEKLLQSDDQLKALAGEIGVGSGDAADSSDSSSDDSSNDGDGA